MRLPQDCAISFFLIPSNQPGPGSGSESRKLFLTRTDLLIIPKTVTMGSHHVNSFPGITLSYSSPLDLR